MVRYAVIVGSLVENVIAGDVDTVLPGKLLVALSSTQAVNAGDTYTAGAFVPRVPAAAEVEANDAPGRMQLALPTLRIWARDAKSAAEITAMTAGERVQRQAVIEQRVANLSRLCVALIRDRGLSD